MMSPVLKKRTVVIKPRVKIFQQVGFLLICFLLSACSNQDTSDVLPPLSDSTMVQVLIELHLAEARADFFQEDQIGYQDSILAHYGISQQDFENNMSFYKENPDIYHKIYSTVLDELSDERFLPENE
ncbi:MAG: DUF4296 domain-containing protein [Rhodothermales bacterium]